MGSSGVRLDPTLVQGALEDAAPGIISDFLDDTVLVRDPDTDKIPETDLPERLGSEVLQATFVHAVTPQMFGAVGDGDHDDTDAVQAAIDSCSAAGGGIVFCVGRFGISSVVLRSNVNLTSFRGMHSYAAAAITPSAAFVAIEYTGDPMIYPAGGAVANASIEGIDFQGQAIAYVGIDLQASTYTRVSRVNFDGFQAQALLSEAGSQSLTLEDLFTTNCLIDTSGVGDTGALDIDGQDHFFSRSEISSYPDPGQATSGALHCNAIMWRAGNSSIWGVIGELSDRGIVVAGSFNKFVACRADKNWGHDWHVTGSANTFSSCVGINGARDGGGNGGENYDAWLIDGQGNAFIGCEAKQAGGNTYRYDFNSNDDGGYGAAQSRNQFIGCTGSGTATKVFKAGLGSHPSGFLPPDVPLHPANGDTTPDVTGTQMLVLDNYAGATTITDFLNGVAAQTLYVIGNPNVTIANGASIVTSTGANKALTAGLYTFKLYNGVWYEHR